MLLQGKGTQGRDGAESMNNAEAWEHQDIGGSYMEMWSMRREELIHKAIVQYLKLAGAAHHFYWLHVPNGGSRNKIEAANLKRMGVIPGVADLMIVPEGGRAHWLEVKSETGKQSPAQKAFAATMEALGSPYAVVRSVDEAEAALKGWGIA